MKKYYLEFSYFDDKYKNTAVAAMCEKLYFFFKNANDIEIEKIIKRKMNSFIYFELYRPFFSLSHKIIVFQNPDSFIPPWQGIVCFHDVIPFEKSKGIRKVYYYFQYYLWMLFSYKIFTFSDEVKNKLIDIYKDKTIMKKIKIIPTVVDQFYIVDQIEKKENFVLAFGSGEPRKNLKRSLQIYKLILDKNPDLKLILYGNNWNNIGHELALKEIRDSGLNGNVIHKKSVTQEELKFLYSKCKCFLFPSNAEGMGLPPLEALGCGAKVVLSDIRIFKEVFGKFKNAYFINLNDQSKDSETIDSMFFNEIDMIDINIIKNLTVENMGKEIYKYMMEW